MRGAIQYSQTFLTAPAWSGYIIESASGLNSSITEDELNAYIALNSGTLFHPVGTAAMSPYGASTGVVNPDLTLKNVAGVRVVDASVLVSYTDLLVMPACVN